MLETVTINCISGKETRRKFTVAETLQRDRDTSDALTDEAEKQQIAQQKAEAIVKLKLSANKDTQDLLKVLGIT